MKFKPRKIDAIIVIIIIVISGIVLYRGDYIPDPKEPPIPTIDFQKDEQNRRLIVISVTDGPVLWKDIDISGDCDKSKLSEYVTNGDIIGDCSGPITITYIPEKKSEKQVLSTWEFEKIVEPPSSLIFPYLRDVSPDDEGAHFKTLLNTREWWYYTVIFDLNSKLAGWSATIAFMHLAWGDLKWTFKPDVLVVVLHSPDGKEYGGLINKDRGGIFGLGILGDPTLVANSPGVDVKYEDSYAISQPSGWHVYAKDNDIDEDNEIIFDLDFLATSQPYWLHSSRLIDKGEGIMANYVFLGCKVTGTVNIDGLDYEVTGTGNYEHSWSPGILKGIIKGWDWCHITLANGWNVYFSNYEILTQITSTKETKINPFATVIITTNNGETLTILENVDISIDSSDNLFLLVKIPKEMSIKAQSTFISQMWLKPYNIQLNLKMISSNTYEKIWKIPTYVGMKIGQNTVTGTISWSDDDGDYELDLSGSGTIWNMRRK